jgi:hypothetical protein
MLQRWTDHNGVEHRVLDDYERNRVLIDLNHQPAEIKQRVDDSIRTMISHKDVGQVGIRFMKFCGKYELNRISDNVQNYVDFLSKAYETK